MANARQFAKCEEVTDDELDFMMCVIKRNNYECISQNKTNVSGKLDSGIFDPEAAYYHFKIIDRSKNLLYDLTADGLTEWSVEVPGTTSFKHDFDKLPIDKIVEQFLEVSHSKKGTIGMTMIKPI
ncbi:13588_t:CDS:2 [Funneliformis caledonium]|uniref:13588_t:CDS:1 n=1 Tax=Funneliformis caledonium TaxID=1117310 RepID=A0A9N9D8E3_9GLOM|nr:13588_t:CDS:2 [Funneliformis caledonium]